MPEGNRRRDAQTGKSGNGHDGRERVRQFGARRGQDSNQWQWKRNNLERNVTGQENQWPSEPPARVKQTANSEQSEQQNEDQLVAPFNGILLSHWSTYKQDTEAKRSRCSGQQDADPNDIR